MAARIAGLAAGGFVARGRPVFRAVGREPAGVLFGRPACDEAQFAAYDEALLSVLAHELGLGRLPIVTRMDFGHTDPMFVLPYGVEAEIDCDARRFAIVEPACEKAIRRE